MNATDRVWTRHRGPNSRILDFASYTLLLVGMAVVGCAAYVVATTKAYQAIEVRAIEDRKTLSRPKRDRVIPIEGSVIGEIEVPRLRLKAVIAQGDSPAILRRAVGHMPDTPLPGEVGNVALAGHRDSLFRPLRNIHPGDTITLQTFDGKFFYRVQSTAVVPPTDVRVLQESGGRELTLITCFPFDFIGPAPNRFVVRARETGQSME